MSKKRYNISIDPDVWELAKHKISEPLSCFIQKQLEIACRLDNEKAAIEKELHEKEREVIALRSQLCKIEKEEHLKRESADGYDDCMSAILRIHDKAGRVGVNQIENIAKAHEVDASGLVSYCKSYDLNVVELFEFVKLGKGSNGGKLR